MQWEDISATYGTAILYRITNPNMIIYRTSEFKSLHGQEKFNLQHNWGSAFTNISEVIHTAIWIKLCSIPVINVWQTPTTLLELKEVCHDQGIELFDLLEKCVPNIRDNKLECPPKVIPLSLLVKKI